MGVPDCPSVSMICRARRGSGSMANPSLVLNFHVVDVTTVVRCVTLDDPHAPGRAVGLRFGGAVSLGHVTVVREALAVGKLVKIIGELRPHVVGKRAPGRLARECAPLP